MKDNVQVFARVRLKLKREEGHAVLVEMKDQTTTLMPPRLPVNSSPSKKQIQEPKEFHFDHSMCSLDPVDECFVSQEKCFDLCAGELLKHTLNGYNTCIFAYGQTGSGKSYTMMGTQREPGIIPRCCEELFDACTAMPESSKAQMTVSFFEIYNEQVRDLLKTHEVNSQLRVREDPVTGPYIEGLQSFPIQVVDDFVNYMKIGNKNRTTGATKMNDKSSRSHAVFTVSIRITEFDSNEYLVRETNSCLRLVDLAGSERADATGATGVRFKEGSNINKSLTTLGRVFTSLTKNEKPPFRDSTLTWLLKESLGGNSKTAMIACISPVDYDETLSTLRYASLVKKIRLEATKNVVDQVAAHNEQEFLELQQKISDLTTSLDEANAKDQLLLQFTNMNKFLEKRLIDQRNQYDLLKSKHNALKARNDKLSGDFRAVLAAIQPNVQITREVEGLKIRHQASIEKLSRSKEQLLRDIENLQMDN
ncbi:unnamed protein product [Cyberlindnera jadinii]|uniref:Kinesin motor domain-containing protein n=1 Tax=Cyberlindnera jadinii (strain ATCC 18201 / CBS 1600 / BCRC 20928 / JCM 3617 / NBRC 0987 / NRRL Y-1542) TaxID=983966 RepID=A0A0H5CBH7_CYBJN|nr:unnamed protein product [Cyberlindnera jadinii]